ncbi:Mrp/NBP35 family ATP-binding protein [Oceanicella sp. SM1341]|uniref:Mrp/NBP35 family ATP-binding protein n=1 Tax=Oceanicella sp. SM1341 TaxID=1548889 RepID=UPI000E494393|nr:Mrp/NBP35 family ATP-binding protein [Oceanicella sp. SM1341]
MSVTEAEVRAALARVVDPSRGTDIVSAGMLGGVSLTGSEVRVILEVDPAKGRAMEPVAKAAEAAVAALPGVTKASVMLTAHSDTPTAPAAPPNLRGAGHGHSHSHGGGAPGEPLRQAAKPQSGPIEGVDRILAIGSGKGGVGKSTVSANLAVALAAEGRRVGLLDADVYGPSQPRMLGISGRPSSPDGQTILPLRNHGVTLMSIGLLTPEDKATIWRGPMLMGALQQMLRQVAWGRLDVLVVDLPPGTGDVQLTLSQKAEVTGAVVVSTPQDIALLDAKKALDMFEKTNTPVVGMIENMSTFVCPCCGEETQIFGHGGARAEAERIGAPFLGEVPLDIDVRLSGDSGVPVVAAKPQSPQALRFREIARKLIGTGHA